MIEVTDRIEGARPRRFPPYPAYKDSGVEWLGAIPAHWEPTRLWRLCTAMSGATPTRENPAYWNGEIPWVSPKDMKRRVIATSEDLITQQALDETGIKLITPQVVLVVVRGMILAHSFPVAVTTVPVTINQDMKALRLIDGVDSFYFAWALHGLARGIIATVVEEAAHGTRAIRMDQWRNLVCPMPLYREQRTIAAFLDRETAKIDALVTRKERLIELLQEKRTALITRAVTRGLDPNVSMEDSGAEWLGEIPAHWDVKRLWHLTPSERKIMYGIVLPGPDVDDGVPIVKGGDVTASRLKLGTLSRTTFEIESHYIRSRLTSGDLVYAIRGSIGEVEMVPAELNGANLTQDAARVAYTRNTHGSWLMYALRSKVVFSQLEAGALGATIKGINIRDLKRALIPVPPKSEQKRISSVLDIETAGFDTLSARVHEAVDHLREFRTALISAAVTGKIDVREAVSP